MLLNKFEFLSMNNPVRAMVQELIEIKRLRQYSRLPKNKTVLEIGCRNGYGTKLIKKYFQPKKIIAIDLDEKMIALARKNNNDAVVTFATGNAARLRFADSMFDAVFDFGVIHHIPNWKECLKELNRVLKPGGELILEDLSLETFATPFGKIMKSVLAHPYNSMYTRQEFVDYLTELNFKIVNTKIYYPLLAIKYFIVIAKSAKG